ncbi:MAG: GGDEF domain-containing protein [Hespellia sp.]|nr:GGDEF domain-containing protein [Hespellia sp.]
MKEALRKLQNSIEQMNRYFYESQESIADSNISLVRGISICGLFTVVVLMLVANYLIEGWNLSAGHLLFFPFFLIYIFWSGCLRQNKKGRKIATHYRLSQLMVVTYMLIFMGLVIYIEIVPYESKIATLVTPAMILLSVIFIVPLDITAFCLCISYVAFCVLSVCCMDIRLVTANVYNGLVGILFGFWVAWIVTNLRAREDHTRQDILQESRHDKLTGVFNKATSEQKCTSYLETHKSDGCALIIIDIDDFKNVNDTYGHRTGDQVLNILGNTLQKVFREWDIKGRIGGDEFVVLMKFTADEDVVKKKMKNFEEIFARTTAEEINTAITCSYGAAVKGMTYIPYNPLFEDADKLLYAAKNCGKAQGKIKTIE